jgi:hypothetical protein
MAIAFGVTPPIAFCSRRGNGEDAVMNPCGLGRIAVGY